MVVSELYYWNGNVDIEEELVSFPGVKSFEVATAFFSYEGLRIVENVAKAYQLSKKNIRIYLSEEFSTDNPHELLEKIIEIATVKIVTRKKLHAKVFLLNGESNHKVIFGSSNMTKGGFKINIEFDQVKETNDISDFDKFFRYIDFKAVEVNDEIIEYYRLNQEKIEKLIRNQVELRKTLSGFLKSDDPFDEEDYDFTDSYFTYEDYETFFPRNSRLNDSEIRMRRKIVQNKILNLHNKVYPNIKAYGIECHWRKDNITSIINPMIYNHHNVGWLGVRYGKTKNELDILNLGAEDEISGFQKHGCIQFCLIPNGFEVNLFLSVRNDSFDRADLHQKFPDKRDAIEAELNKLKGMNLKWVIENDDESYEFDFDQEDIISFYDFYMKYDKPGRSSYLIKIYEPDDEHIQTVDSIAHEIVEYTEKLLPLYNLIVFRINI